MNLLERLPDSLVSIGLDAPTLLAFKQHAALAPDDDWTEADLLLQGYLSAAERSVDEITASPYRGRSFKYSVERMEQYTPSWRARSSWFSRCNSFWSIKLPMRPVTGTPTIAWTASDGTTGTWTAGTDFTVFGSSSLTPEIIFPYDFVLPPTDGVPFPFVVTFNAGGGIDTSVGLVCIFEYAAAYYRSPESVGEKLTYVSKLFQANMDLLQASFL